MQSLESDSRRLKQLTRLGEDVVYTPSAGAPVTIKAIFEADREVIEVINGIQTIGYKPFAECRTSDLTGTIRGGTIVVNSTTYTIREVTPDGTGMTDLILEQTS